MLIPCKALMALFLKVVCSTGEPNATVDKLGDEGSEEKAGRDILWQYERYLGADCEEWPIKKNLRQNAMISSGTEHSEVGRRLCERWARGKSGRRCFGRNL